MKENEINELIENNYKELNNYFRNTFRKSELSSKEAERILNESIHILKNLAERPFDYLGLTSITCDKCGKVSFIYKNHLKDFKKVGNNFPNHCCTFCGRYLIEDRNLIKLVRKLIEVIPKEEESIITDLKYRLNNMEFLLLPEQIPVHEEKIYEIISECIPNDIEYNDFKEWQKAVINIWNNK